MDKILKCKSKTIKILEENIGSKISDVRHRNIFANIYPKALETKHKINKWNYVKLKSFSKLKKPSARQIGNRLYGRTFLAINLTRVQSPKYTED